MTKVLVDEDLGARLGHLAEHAELCDNTGRTLGYFLPPAVFEKLFCASLQVPFSEEEIARRREATGGRPLAEIWQSLGRP
jgi:hypothetical protein